MSVRPGRSVLAMAGAVLVLAGGIAPAGAVVTAGDGSPAAMTTAQARRAYLALACPLNASIAALDRAEETGSWPAVRTALRAVAAAQLRAARRFDHPPAPWPADVRTLVPAIRDMDTYGAGVEVALSLAGSMAAYEAMNAQAGDGRLPGDALVRAGSRAVVKVRGRLGLPATGGCPPVQPGR